MTKQTYEGHKTPTYREKGLRKFKGVQARLLFKLCETSVTSRMVENVSNIVLLLIAADVTDTVPVLEKSPMMPSIFRES